MKKLFFIIGFVCLSASVLAETKPSDASLEELLTVTEAQKLIDGMWPQVENMMNNASIKALGDTSLNDEQKSILQSANAKMSAVFKEEFSFDKMKPSMIGIYKDSFSQEEINGMLSFYKSKAGKAVVKKMPLVIQASMANMQTQMLAVIPKIQKIQQEAIDEVKAKADAKPAATSDNK